MQHHNRGDAPGLSRFQLESFDLASFIESIYPGDDCIAGTESDEELSINAFDQLPLDTIDELFSSALKSIESLHQDVDEQISNELKRNYNETENLSKLLQDQIVLQTRLEQEVAGIERRFTELAPPIIGVGRELEGLSKDRVKIGRAEDLLCYYNEFKKGSNPDFPVFRDWPARLVDAALVISELRQVAAGVTVGDTEKARENISKFSDRILEELLNGFDKASRRTDLASMKVLGDAVMRYFAPMRGGQVLFRRFISHCLEPLVAPRSAAATYKLVALEENLAVMFRQMRNSLRVQYEVVRVVFPEHKDQVMALLVERLFNDPDYGLFLVLQTYLDPTKLPNHEFLQVLAEAHAQTQILADELVQGITCTAPALPITKPHVNQSTWPESKTYLQPTDRMRLLGSASNNTGPSSRSNNNSRSLQGHGVLVSEEHIKTAHGKITTVVKFDHKFVQKLVKSVFLPFKTNYLQHEVDLFQQRCSQSLYSVLPADFVSTHQPNLPQAKGLHIDATPQLISPTRNEATKDTSFTSSATTPENPTQHAPEKGSFETYLDSPGKNGAQISELHQKGLEDETYSGNRTSFIAKFESNLSPLTQDLLVAMGCFEDQDETAETVGDNLLKAGDSSLGDSVPVRMLQWTLDAKVRANKILGGKANVPHSMETRIVETGRDSEGGTYDNKYPLAVKELFDLLVSTLISGMLLPAVNSILAKLPTNPSIQRNEVQDQALLEPTIRVVGKDAAIPLRARNLPMFASQNSSVKASTNSILEHYKAVGDSFTIQSFIRKVSVPHAEVTALIATVSKEMKIVEQLMWLWSVHFKPVLQEYGTMNLCTTCETQLVHKIQVLDKAITNGIDRILSHSSVHFQSVLLALGRKSDYMSNVGEPVEAEATIAVTCFCQCLREYLDACDVFLHGSCKAVVMNRLVLMARDALLASLRKKKVGMIGAFVFKADVDAFAHVVSEETSALKVVPELIQALDELNFIPPLLFVEAGYLPEMIQLESVGPTTSVSLCHECIALRVDGANVA